MDRILALISQRTGRAQAPRPGLHDSVRHPGCRGRKPDRLLGRTRGETALRAEVGLLPLDHPREAGARRGLLRQARGKAVFLARFFSGLRVFGALVAGISRMRWATFFLYNALGGAVWATAVVLIGYFLGSSAWPSGGSVRPHGGSHIGRVAHISGVGRVRGTSDKAVWAKFSQTSLPRTISQVFLRNRG
jgi:hypothetical protein